MEIAACPVQKFGAFRIRSGVSHSDDEQLCNDVFYHD